MICFHHNDPDGRCAAAIVNKKYSEYSPKFIEMDYSTNVPFNTINKNETVYIVDFSFKPKDMEKLLTITKDIRWVDHHKTILDHPFNIQSIYGIREIGRSGALLTWEYLFNTYPPKAVELISDYDCWILSDERSKPFVFGLQMWDLSPKSEIWKELFDSDSTIPHLVTIGQTCLDFVEKFGYDYGKTCGFETKFEEYECFAQGFYMFGSNAFGKRINKYDICLSYEFLGDKWVVGLYSVNPNIDVSEIAKRYGGGGHKGAAGFVCSELPFKKNSY